MYTLRLIAFLLLGLSGLSLQALDSLDQRLLDFARSKPPNKNMSLHSLAVTLRTEAKTDLKSAEVAFYWITEHINYDFNAKNNAADKINLEDVLQSRTGNYQTFSQLYRELCTLMGIRCYLVPGYVWFRNAYDIEYYDYTGRVYELPKRPYHSWNMVKIGGEYYGVDLSLGSGMLSDDIENPVFIKKYDLDQVLSQGGVFFRIHLPADPRWQLSEHPIPLETFHSDLSYDMMMAKARSSEAFDYQNAIAKYENASPAEQRLMSLQSTLAFNSTDFTKRQLADALYNMGYTQSLGEYETDRLLSARKYYERAIATYENIERTEEVKQLMAQAQQGVRYVAYRLEKKQ